jgi:hypothetical protein
MKSLADLSPANARSYRETAGFERSRFEYLVQRRDALNDSARTGCLALNAGSLVALFSLAGASAEAAERVGFTQERTAYCAAAFAIGAILAAVSTLLEANRTNTEAGDAVARLIYSRALASAFENEATEEANKRLVNQMMEFHKLALVDFQYSAAALWARGLSGGAWLVGVLLPLLHLFGW